MNANSRRIDSQDLRFVPLDEEALWTAVLAKDSRFDGRFVFAVQSTGIYCRPSCPARRPRRERVSFFRLPEAAERAGFRPCRRCHPKRARLEDPQVELIQRVCRFIEAHAQETVTLAQLSEHTGLSSFHLQRTFKRLMGVSPRRYAIAWRMRDFKTRVREGESITAAMYDVGFGSSSRLYERTSGDLGMTPGAYSQGGRGVTIQYTLVQCFLGRLLVAATARGICSVRLGESDASLEEQLRSEYPEAGILRKDSALRDSVSELLDYLEGEQSGIDLPLDIRATAFQWQVWESLRAIPYGQTRSYKEVAKQIGQPKAVRAVARAVASNPVALLIPCHRVIRENKSLGGYRWGLERKKRLLDKEKSKI